MMASEAQFETQKLEDMDCRAWLNWPMTASEAQFKPQKLKTYIAGPG